MKRLRRANTRQSHPVTISTKPANLYFNIQHQIETKQEEEKNKKPNFISRCKNSGRITSHTATEQRKRATPRTKPFFWDLMQLNERDRKIFLMNPFTIFLSDTNATISLPFFFSSIFLNFVPHNVRRPGVEERSKCTEMCFALLSSFSVALLLAHFLIHYCEVATTMAAHRFLSSRINFYNRKQNS